MTSTPTLPFPVQRPLTLVGARRVCEPLALIPTARHWLDCGEDEVMELIWDLQLVAFNLARARAAKTFVAIWTKSLLGMKDMRDRAAKEASPIHPEFYGPEKPEAFQVVNDLFPHRRDTLGLTELRVAFCCSATHIHHLIADGLLRATGGDKVSKAPAIWRASVVEFLKARRL